MVIQYPFDTYPMVVINCFKFHACTFSSFGVKAYVHMYVRTESRFIQGGPKVGGQ